MAERVTSDKSAADLAADAIEKVKQQKRDQLKAQLKAQLAALKNGKASAAPALAQRKAVLAPDNGSKKPPQFPAVKETGQAAALGVRSPRCLCVRVRPFGPSERAGAAVPGSAR